MSSTIRDTSEVAVEEQSDEIQPRWGLLLLLAVSIMLAAYAQYLFGKSNSFWYDSAILYTVAVLLFVHVIRRAKELPSRDQPTRMHWWAQMWAGFEAQPFRNVLLVLAIFTGWLAAHDANGTPPPESFTFAIFLWLTSMVAFGAAFVPWGKLRLWRVPAPHVIKAALCPYATEIIIVVALMALAFVLRAYDVGNIPINFGGDEAEMGLQALQVLDGRLTNPFATSWYSHPTLFFFLQSLSLRVFGQSVAGLRVLSVIIGTLTILTTYLLVRQLHSHLLAVVASALLAVYPYHIQFSRLGLNNIADPFWATTVFFLTIRGMITRRNGYFVGAGIALGLSQYFYHGVRLVPFMLAVFLAFWLLAERRAALSRVRDFIIMGVAALLAALPIIFFLLHYPHLFAERYNQMGIFPSGWLAREAARLGQDPLTLLARRTAERFLLFNYYPDNSGFYGPGTPLLETFSAILFVFGLTYSIYRLRERGFSIFVIWFVLGVLAGAVLVIDEAGSARTVTLTVPLMFFVAVALVKLAEILADLSARPAWQWQIIVVVVALLAIINTKFYFFDYVPKRTYGGIGWENTEIVKYLLAQPHDFKAYFFGPPFDYLTHGTIAFMVPHLNGMDVLKPIHGPPDFVDRSLPAIFLFIPPRQNEFVFVQQAFPNGKRIDYHRTNGQLLFFAYEVQLP